MTIETLFGQEEVTSKPRTVEGLTTNPCLQSSAARVRVLLQVQRRGLIGSPRVVGFIILSSASKSPGCSVVNDLRPPPLRRCRSGANGSGLSSSLIPVRIVRSEIPVAVATATIPPRPSDLASIAAHLRRPRSSSSDERCRYLSRIHSTSDASCIA